MDNRIKSLPGDIAGPIDDGGARFPVLPLLLQASTTQPFRYTLSPRQVNPTNAAEGAGFARAIADCPIDG